MYLLLRATWEFAVAVVPHGWVSIHSDIVFYNRESLFFNLLVEIGVDGYNIYVLVSDVKLLWITLYRHFIWGGEGDIIKTYCCYSTYCFI